MADGATQSLSIGTTVHQRYQILSIVGRGGLGTVYQVSDVLFGKQNVYALKELLDQSPGARKQFEYECRWLQSLDHNHIPRFREYFEWENCLYLVMDFVDGENLEQKLTRQGGRPISEADALRWALPICDALQYLHSRMPPILHRDVKPANIIVTPSGHPVLVDLGIAKEHLPGANQTATFVRKAGTEGYAPPEQYTAAGKTGPWSDVYGLGATLYHLLTGGLPPTAVERIALDRRLLRPREVNPAVSPHVDEAIYRSLALRPADRFQTMRDFAQALTASRNATSLPRPQMPLAAPVPHSMPPFSQTQHTPALRPAERSGAPSQLPSLSSQPSGPLVNGRAPRPADPSHTSRSPQSSHTLTGPIAIPSDHNLGREEERPEPPERGGFPKRLVFGSAAVAVLIVLSVLAFVLLNAVTPPDRSSPHATITGYFAALTAHDYSRAWQYSSASRNNDASENAFISGLQADDARSGYVLTATIIQITQDTADSATATVNVTRARAPTSVTSYTITLSFYDGNTWLIDNISSS